MRAVGIRELKNKLSEFLRLVRAGEEVLVTDRGRVIAVLGPPQRSALQDLPPGIADLVRRGLVTRLPTRANSPDAYAVMPKVVPDGAAERAINWLREDKR